MAQYLQMLHNAGHIGISKFHSLLIYFYHQPGQPVTWIKRCKVLLCLVDAEGEVE